MRVDEMRVDGVRVTRTCLDDWTELLEYADRVLAGARGQYFRDFRSSSLLPERSGNTWYMTETLDEAVQLARYGWSEGRARLGAIQAQLNILKYLPMGFRTQPYFAVAGDEPDIGRMLSGEPEHMMTMRPRVVRNGKLIRLIVQISFPHTTTIEQIFFRGAAVLACLEIVQMLGYTLQITVVNTAHKNSRMLETYIPIHHAGDRLNLDTLAFMLVHPSVLRRLVFARQECLPRRIREWYGFYHEGGYGVPNEALALPEHDCFVADPFGFPTDLDQTLLLTQRILKECGIDIRIPFAA